MNSHAQFLKFLSQFTSEQDVSLIESVKVGYYAIFESEVSKYGHDLSQFSEIHLSGSNLKVYDHNGNTLVGTTGVTAEELPSYIGQDLANKLLAQEPEGTLRSLYLDNDEQDHA